jgi:predicted glutamine amidotransferase
MCGILGLMTQEQSGYFSQDKDAFRSALVLTSLRGRDSTGVFGVSKFEKDNEPSIIKVTGSPYALYDYEKSNEFFNRMLNRFNIVVGHARYATRGEVNAENAHPFREDNIVLVHNGVINNFSQLHDPVAHKGIEVDSHLITRLLADEDPIDVLSKIEGAYVFVWFDTNTGRLNIARNNQRPLFFMDYADKRTTMFASEAETLLWHSQRHRVKLGKIRECPEMQLMSFHKNDMANVEVTPYKHKPIKKWWNGLGSEDYEAEKVEQWRNRAGTNNTGTLHTPRYNKAQEKGNIKSTRRPMSAETDRADKLMVETISNQHELILHSEVDFQLYDYEYKDGYIHVIGHSDAYPMVEFSSCLVTRADEDSLVNCVALRGEISSMVMVGGDNTEKEINWRVFVSKVTLITDAGQTDLNGKLISQRVDDAPFLDTDALEAELDAQHNKGSKAAKIIDQDPNRLVQILDFGGVMHRLKFFRLEQLACNGCDWCNGIITSRMLANPEYLLIVEGGDKKDALVCSVCAERVLEHLSSVQSGMGGLVN